ncbi:MAG: exo-alpha-sialidase [Actinobacteria bacterium]|nr:MAG: exo-alpha-sialidase [Actinomycetota bacterium]
MSRPRAAVAGFLASAVIVGLIATHAPAAVCPEIAPLSFGAQHYVDDERVGGEPVVLSLRDGTLVYAAHASTTLLYAPGGAGQGTTSYYAHYQGQTYAWYSTDHGATWTFVPRDQIPTNIPGSGFSDPDLAVDSAGQVYLSEINLLNIAVSKSTDGGKSYTDMTDREWMDADGRDVLYETGNPSGGGTSTSPVGHVNHTIYRSTDGGQTFTPFPDPDGGEKIRVDKRDGTVYEMQFLSGGVLAMGAFRKARSGNMMLDVHPVAKISSLVQSSFDVDSAGGLHLAWSETGGTRSPGVYYSSSTDAGRTWRAPLRIDTDDKTDYWVTVAAGDAGRAGIAWFQADVHLPKDRPDTKGTHGWHVMAAQVVAGRACGASASSLLPVVHVAQATKKAFHIGQICTQGTACEALARDRRLGDYFTNAIDDTGAMVISYSDTMLGGVAAMPAFVRQSGGESFRASATALPVGATPQKTPRVLGSKRTRASRSGKGLAATGLPDSALTLAGFGLLFGAAALRRRRA